MNYNDLLSKIKNSSVADFGNIFNYSIELFKKAWVQGLLFVIFSFLMIIALEIILIIPLVLFTSVSFITNANFSYLNSMSIIGIVIIVFAYLFFILAIMTISNGLKAGLFVIYKKIDHEENYSTNDFFIFFKREHLMKILLVGLAQVVVTIFFCMLCVLPIIYAMIPLSLFIIVFAFNPHLSVSEIVKLSFSIGNKNWIQSFLLLIVMYFISLLGFLLCIVGYFVTFALLFIPMYFIYKNAVGFESKNIIDEIGNNVAK